MTMLRSAQLRAVANSHRCATEAIRLEQDGAHKSYDCAHWWLGAVVSDLGARVLGYKGPTLEEQMGRPPRPLSPMRRTR
jgi:hypothetical protein